MSKRVQGIGASPGRAMGRVRRVRLDIPTVEHRTISRDDVESELERFHAARECAASRTRELGRRTAERLGEIEAKIFEPQALMLEDPDLVEGTVAYIRDNFLAAERAFEWRLLEIRSRFLDTAHAMVADRLADLRDVRTRVLAELLDDPAPLGADAVVAEEPAVLVFEELTPSFTLRLEPEGVLGVVAASGSRASHSAVLARSLGIPAVVGAGPDFSEVADGTIVILDGSTGRLLVDPEEEERKSFQRARERHTERRRRLEELAARPSETADRVPVRLRVNLDQPSDLEEAVSLRPDGVGLFRSEFLVIGRRTVPSEEKQYRDYRRVVESFRDEPVTLRTFDIGGDKFPIFLNMPFEENPYLGWRAIRVCLDLPELFRNQLRAGLRAARHGSLRLLLPMIVSVEEIRRTRDLLREVRGSLEWGEEDPEVPLGIMVETPAAAETLDLLAPHVDFLSLGSNDLTQYALAVDRDNARLADLYDPLHPALFRLYRRILREARSHDLPIGVCGEISSDPVGVAALLGLGYRDFSLPASAFPEVKEWIRAVEVGELEEICGGIAGCESADEIREPVRQYLEAVVPDELAVAEGLSVPL